MSEQNQADWLEHLRTEPLTCQELATHFQTCSKYVGQMVEAFDGTERIGRGEWRSRVTPKAVRSYLGKRCPGRLPSDEDTRKPDET